jgi:DNA (cytosine-5)-methyltransferase 1
MTKKSQPTFRYIDLFAGVGGFAAALNALGGEVRLAAEIDELAAATYEANLGHNPRRNVIDVAKNSTALGSYQVLTGGFPCQPFSKSGAQKGTSEPRGTLFGEIEKIVNGSTPLLIVLENVRNLAGPRHREEWNRIINFLRHAGYRVASEPAEFSPHLLSKSQGGRPHHRVRIFITATYNPGPGGHNFESPPPAVTLKSGIAPKWNLVSDLPLKESVDSRYGITTQERLWIEAWEKVVVRWKSEYSEKLPGFPLWSDYWLRDRPSGFESMPQWKQRFVLRNMDFYMKDRQFLDEWLENNRVREEFPNSRRKFEWQAGDLDSIWKCLIQMRPSGIRVKSPNYVPTLVALNQTPIYGPFERRITELEAASLQGFPENWQPNPQSSTATYKQMGNAVNIGVIAHVFREHCKRDLDVLSTSAEGRRVLEGLSNSPENPDEVFASWGHKVRPPN